MANITTSTTSVQVSLETLLAVREIARLRDEQKKMAEQEALIRKQLLEVAGSADELVFEGVAIANIQRSTRTGTDTKALAEKFPEAFAETRTTTPQVKVVVL